MTNYIVPNSFLILGDSSSKLVSLKVISEKQCYANNSMYSKIL